MKELNWITKNICQYVFIEDEDDPFMDVNITVLINDNHAMLIDTAYSRHATEVKDDLSSKGITVDQIVLTHYHPDHAAGATEYPDAIVSCGSYYEENFNNCNDVWDKDHAYRKPQHIILDNSSKSYGDFSLTFYESPGHSKCSIITIIDDNVAHVGDLLMTDMNGKPTVPAISGGGSFQEHLKSLHLLKELGAETLILSHGDKIVGKEAIDHGIELRAHYLKSVIESNGEAELEDILMGGTKNWSYIEGHTNNLKRL